MYVVMLSVKEIEEHACRVRENDFVTIRYKYKNDYRDFNLRDTQRDGQSNDQFLVMILPANFWIFSS